MEEAESQEPLPARGEAEGAQSADEPLAAPSIPTAQNEPARTSGDTCDPESSHAQSSEASDIQGSVHVDKETSREYSDPLAEAAMNILRTQRLQMDLEQEGNGDDEDDNAFSDYGDGDRVVGSGKQIEQIDCNVGMESKSSDLAKQLSDLHIDIPNPVNELKRRSSSIAELSDVEATGSMEWHSPREDPVGSAVGSLPLHGTLSMEGDMVSYVADDLTEKIRQSVGSSRSTSGATTPAYPSTCQMFPWAATPTSITSSTSSTEFASSPASSLIPPVDPEALADLEKQCHRVADNLNLMLGHLSNSLHNMSAITVGHIQTYRDAVEKAGITVDQSVKAMYALMAKVEELNFAMPAVYDLAKQIKSLQSQLDALENLCK